MTPEQRRKYKSDWQRKKSADPQWKIKRNARQRLRREQIKYGTWEPNRTDRIQGENKVCGGCGILRPFSDYWGNDLGRAGLRSHCKQCLAEQAAKWRAGAHLFNRKQLLKRYGLSLEDYNDMALDQGGVCAICGQINTREAFLSVDHCHATKKVRGLLCDKCNKGLGSFRDSPELLLKAFYYLHAALKSLPVKTMLITEEYTKLKLAVRDYHGVADAAMDLRDIVAAHPELEHPKGVE